MILIANQKLVNYIRTNKSTYSVEKLKSYLVQQGYSQGDVDAAAVEVTGNTPQASAIGNPFKITVENKPKLINSAKWGAIYGAIAGAIIGVASILSTFLISLRFAFLAGSAGIISTSLGFVSNVFWGAVWGTLFGFVLIMFYEKIWFDTLFKKVFYVRVALDVLLALIFSFGASFTGPLAYLTLFGGTILADFVYAKMFAKKMGALHEYV